MRKALFLGTGGASGAVIRANSKKERAAKAAEQQVRLQQQMLEAAPPSATVTAVETPAAREGGEFDVVLAAVSPSKKIATIKVVREATGLGLREAKAIVDHPPSAVRACAGAAEANALKARLEDFGATAEIKAFTHPTSLAEPDGGLAGELARLAELHRDGSLDDAEFAAAKNKMLGT